MTEENGVERPSLKLTLKSRDSQYTIVNPNPDDQTVNGEDRTLDEDLDVNNSEMTDSTPDNSLGENGHSMHDNSDELNTPNVSPEKEIPPSAQDNSDDFTNTEYSFAASSFPSKENGDEGNSSNPPSETSVSNPEIPIYPDKEVGEPSSTVSDSEDIKPVTKEEEDRPSDPPVVIKKEKTENGEIDEKQEHEKEIEKSLLSKLEKMKQVMKSGETPRPNIIPLSSKAPKILLRLTMKPDRKLHLVNSGLQNWSKLTKRMVLNNNNFVEKSKFQSNADNFTEVLSSGESSDGEKSTESDATVLAVETPAQPPTDNGTSNPEDENDDAETVLAVPQGETRPMISVRKTEDLLISKVQVNGSLEEPCTVCGKRFGSVAQLEQHKATAGHYNCSDCAGSVFQTLQELGQHQASHHQSSVQQLAQQVQRIPAQFQSQAFRVPTPPQRNMSPQYMSPPPMVPYYQGVLGVAHEGTSQTIGSGVVLSPVPSSPVPNLPPGIQLSKRPATMPPESSSPKQRREELETRRLPDSITLSRTPATPPSPARNSVTDMLANRGITVVPSGRSANPPQPTTPTLPRALSSAISITPSSQQQQQRQSNFAIPAPKSVSRVLTVDLTKESDTPPRRTQIQSRGRMRGPSTRSVCQICDKAFPTPQELQAHMAIHRGGAAPNKLAYECRECTAQYPTEAGLQAHRQKYHGAGGPSPDMAIPVVDLKQVGVMSRLAALGIRCVIPLSQLHSGSGNGLFGLPVVAVDAANNPAICNIGGLGASNLLPLGPLKNLTFNNNLR